MAKREYGWSTDIPEESSQAFVANHVVMPKDCNSAGGGGSGNHSSSPKKNY